MTAGRGSRRVSADHTTDALVAVTRRQYYAEHRSEYANSLLFSRQELREWREARMRAKEAIKALGISIPEWDYWRETGKIMPMEDGFVGQAWFSRDGIFLPGHNIQVGGQQPFCALRGTQWARITSQRPCTGLNARIRQSDVAEDRGPIASSG